jgi:hypothetical protein
MLKEEHRLRVFENKVLGPKRNEVMGDKIKLHNEEELHSFYFSPNIIRMIKSRRMKWVGHENCTQNFGWKA